MMGRGNRRDGAGVVGDRGGFGHERHVVVRLALLRADIKLVGEVAGAGDDRALGRDDGDVALVRRGDDLVALGEKSVEALDELRVAEEELRHALDHARSVDPANKQRWKSETKSNSATFLEKANAKTRDAACLIECEEETYAVDLKSFMISKNLLYTSGRVSNSFFTASRYPSASPTLSARPDSGDAPAAGVAPVEPFGSFAAM